MTSADPRNHAGFFVAAASREWGCVSGTTWPPCRCARCIIIYTGRPLAHHYGRERAVEILAGRDEAANADLAAWKALGARREAAA